MLRQVDILGVPVSAVDMRDAVAEITRWIDRRQGGYVCAADMNSVMQAQRNPQHMEALRTAAMVVPDGTPLVWTARSRGERHLARVPGPDLMMELCEAGVGQGWRHFLYGGAEDVAKDLAAALQRVHPGICVAGFRSPPFRPLTVQERDTDVEKIAEADPHIIWVGLGCPKQEAWMRENAPRLGGAVVIGVGAAFNFHSNRIRRAPPWMRRSGLEWLHRLASEPRRLWRRYLLLGPEFLLRVSGEALRQRMGRHDAARLPDEGR